MFSSHCFLSAFALSDDHLESSPSHHTHCASYFALRMDGLYPHEHPYPGRAHAQPMLGPLTPAGPASLGPHTIPTSAGLPAGLSSGLAPGLSTGLNGGLGSALPLAGSTVGGRYPQTGSTPLGNGSHYALSALPATSLFDAPVPASTGARALGITASPYTLSAASAAAATGAAAAAATPLSSPAATDAMFSGLGLANSGAVVAGGRGLMHAAPTSVPTLTPPSNSEPSGSQESDVKHHLYHQTYRTHLSHPRHHAQHHNLQPQSAGLAVGAAQALLPAGMPAAAAASAVANSGHSQHSQESIGSSKTARGAGTSSITQAVNNGSNEYVSLFGQHTTMPLPLAAAVNNDTAANDFTFHYASRANAATPVPYNAAYGNHTMDSFHGSYVGGFEIGVDHDDEDDDIMGSAVYDINPSAVATPATATDASLYSCPNAATLGSGNGKGPALAAKSKAVGKSNAKSKSLSKKKGGNAATGDDDDFDPNIDYGGFVFSPTETSGEECYEQCVLLSRSLTTEALDQFRFRGHADYLDPTCLAYLHSLTCADPPVPRTFLNYLPRLCGLLPAAAFYRPGMHPVKGNPDATQAAAASDHSYALQSQCEVCASGAEESLMLLCDVCNRGFHTFCIALGRTPPDGDMWVCLRCVFDQRSRDVLAKIYNEQVQLRKKKCGIFYAAQGHKKKATSHSNNINNNSNTNSNISSLSAGYNYHATTHSSGGSSVNASTSGSPIVDNSNEFITATTNPQQSMSTNQIVGAQGISNNLATPQASSSVNDDVSRSGSMNVISLLSDSDDEGESASTHSNGHDNAQNMVKNGYGNCDDSKTSVADIASSAGGDGYSNEFSFATTSPHTASNTGGYASGHTHAVDAVSGDRTATAAAAVAGTTAAATFVGDDDDVVFIDDDDDDDIKHNAFTRIGSGSGTLSQATSSQNSTTIKAATFKMNSRKRVATSSPLVDTVVIGSSHSNTTNNSSRSRYASAEPVPAL